MNRAVVLCAAAVAATLIPAPRAVYAAPTLDPAGDVSDPKFDVLSSETSAVRSGSDTLVEVVFELNDPSADMSTVTPGTQGVRVVFDTDGDDAHEYWLFITPSETNSGVVIPYLFRWDGSMDRLVPFGSAACPYDPIRDGGLAHQPGTASTTVTTKFNVKCLGSPTQLRSWIRIETAPEVGDRVPDSGWAPSVPTGVAPPRPIVPVRPARFADSRPGFQTSDHYMEGFGRLAAGQRLIVPIGGRRMLPGDLAGVVVNVTAVNPDTFGYLTVYPCGVVPNASTVNFAPGVATPNAATVKLSAGGDICVYTSVATDVVVDVNGFVPAGSPLTLRNPARLADTRSGFHTIDGDVEGVGKVGTGQTLRIPVSGRAAYGSANAGALLNVVATGSATPGFLTVYPCDQPRPNTSSVNFMPFQTIANSVVVGATGDVCVYASAATHVVVDITGVIPEGTTFAPLTPRRFADTRSGFDTFDGRGAGTGRIAAGQALTVPVTGRGGIAAGVRGVTVNVTATAPLGFGYLTVYPCDQSRPNASNLNYTPFQTVANAATVKLSPAGTLCVFSSAETDIVVDVTGVIVE